MLRGCAALSLAQLPLGGWLADAPVCRVEWGVVLAKMGGAKGPHCAKRIGSLSPDAGWQRPWRLRRWTGSSLY